VWGGAGAVVDGGVWCVGGGWGGGPPRTNVGGHEVGGWGERFWGLCIALSKAGNMMRY
jgi:hypothetical protein